MRFQIVDAFSNQLFGGNPAGVVLIPEGRDFPSDETMRLTAAELRYSETAFVKPLGNGNFQTRYFTPAAEVELCGHATIGSSYALTKFGLAAPGDTIHYETLSGPIDIVIREDSILMDMAEPKELGAIDEDDAIDELYQIMGLDPKGQGDVEEAPAKELLPRIVSTGLADIMMPVADEEQLDKIAPDFPALAELSKRYEVTGVHAFTVNSKDGLIHARNFAPLYDIDEEAATGTSNGALTFYLYNDGLIDPEDVNTVVQGEKMGRPSRISTQLILEDGQPKVKVGGLAVALAEGEIAL